MRRLALPEITKHEEGAFSYSDLQTTDLDSATTFYTDLFGWKTDDVPMSEQPGEIYRQFTKNGKIVCAAANQRPEQVQAGAPPMWNVYFTVDDVDLKAKEAEAAGGTVHVPPFDVFDAGRMTVISDPAGAYFCLWQPKESIGSYVMHEANTVDWAESGSTDVPKARDFYKQVMGWTHEDMNMTEGPTYTLFSAAGEYVAGLMPSQMPMSYWSMYFQVEDCPGMTNKAKSLGAQTMLENMTVEGVGTMSICTDQQGAMFGMIQPEQTS
jgi:predicted enzyme related to lactoylglutathione lyase